ncbi:MAG: DUF4245 family protein [Candidatus Nanopelagicales bacterium]
MSTPQPTGRSMRGLRKNVGDMIRSMLVVLAVVGAILLVTWRPQPDPIREVSLEPLVSFASSQAGFPVFILDTEAQPTSVRWEPTEESSGEMVWHIGYVTPGDHYLQLSQSLTDSETYLDEQTSNGVVLKDDADLPSSVRQLMAEGWVPAQNDDANPRRSLLATLDGSTTILSGTGDWSEVADAARSLVVP